MEPVVQPEFSQMILSMSLVFIVLLVMALFVDYLIYKFDKIYPDNNVQDEITYSTPDEMLGW